MSTKENTVGQRLKALRLSHKMSQQQFGNIGEVQRSYVSQVESGRAPSSEYLEKIASYFSLSVEDFSMKPKAIAQLRELIEQHNMDDVIAGLESILAES